MSFSFRTNETELTEMFTSTGSEENSKVKTCPAVPATINASVFVHSEIFCMANRGSSQYGSKSPV